MNNTNKIYIIKKLENLVFVAEKHIYYEKATNNLNQPNLVPFFCLTTIFEFPNSKSLFLIEGGKFDLLENEMKTGPLIEMANEFFIFFG